MTISKNCFLEIKQKLQFQGLRYTLSIVLLLSFSFKCTSDDFYDLHEKYTIPETKPYRASDSRIDILGCENK